MVRKGDDLWLRRHALPGPVANNPIMEFFGLNEMIMVVRQAAGASWRPRRVILRCHDEALLEAMPHLAGGSAVFGAEFAAIPIPIRFLSRLMTHGHGNDGMLATDDAPPDWSSPPERFADILLEIISARFPDGYPAIETMAECIGVTPRTVQRKLAADRLTYRELIDYHRFETAKRMILEDRVRIIDIAAELDYEHASSFARAFRRWAGVSPRDYRSQQLITY